MRRHFRLQNSKGEKTMEKLSKLMENTFKLRENGTTVKTEIIAGVTTFMTMAYKIGRASCRERV